MAHESNPTDEVINLVPSDLSLTDIPKGLVAKVGSLKVLRLVVAAGEEVAEHKASGAISVVCLAGYVDFVVGETTHHLDVNSMICLPEGTLHSVKAIKDSVLLVNIVSA